MALQTRKKMNKQVKKDIKASLVEANNNSPDNDTNVKALLSRLPAKKRKKEKALLGSLEKSLKAKKKKALTKHSKRTNTGLIDAESPPSSPHIEGKHWIKVANRQTQTKNKTLIKKSLKTKS